MVERAQRKKAEEASKNGETFSEPLYAIELAHMNLVRAAELKLHPTMSERVLETLPFYASVRGVRYFLLTKRNPSVEDGLRVLKRAINEFSELTKRYKIDDQQAHGLYNQAKDLYSYIEEGLARFPDRVEEFEQYTDELDQAFRRARKLEIR